MSETVFRLDVRMTQLGLAQSRQKAQQLIKEQKVQVNGSVASKPSAPCRLGDEITLLAGLKYVGRGGQKLERALDAFGINPAGLCCLDVGASTGGFTDCLLQRGAKHVFAVDVGTNQLDESLRGDPRVTSAEQTDIRGLEKSRLPFVPDVVVCDVSFISLRLIVPKIGELLAAGGTAVMLVKPQFEVGKKGLGKNGIVKDEKLRKQAVEDIADAVRQHGFTVIGAIESPVAGGDGNIEYLLAASLRLKADDRQEGPK